MFQLILKSQVKVFTSLTWIATFHLR